MAKNVEGTLYESITGQLFEIGRQLRQPKGYPYNPEQLKLHLQTAIEGRFHIDPLDDCYHVTVDYDQTLQQMIDNGKYDYASSNINDRNFPVTGNGKQDVVIKFVHYGWRMESDDVLRDLESRGMRSVTLPELLAFGSTHSEKQREFPIVALGSVWQQDRHAQPYLSKWRTQRKLYMGWPDNGWSDLCRFAVVLRK